MPMNFGSFEFASPPRTATSWIRSAAAEAGLMERDRVAVHVPHQKSCNSSGVIRLSCVRHPCTWLRSWYAAIYPAIIEVEAVDHLRRMTNPGTFDHVVRQLLVSSPGCIGRMHAAYGADVVIRVEDLPWAFVEFLESVGVERRLRERCLLMPAQNATKPEKLPEWNPCLHARVLVAENEFASKYEY
jgi:hypothetical protein